VTDSTCAVAHCPKPLEAETYCSKHLAKWRKYGVATWRERARGPRACKVEDCDAPYYGRGFCHPHYTRWREFGEDNPRLRGEVRKGCKICTSCGEDKPLDEYGIDKSVVSGRAIYCKTCNHTTSVKARTSRWGNESTDFTRDDIFDRDGWRCQICHESIDRVLTHPDPMSPSMDHIVPISLGGANVPDNCQATHLVCNLRKGRSIAPKAG
jgi:hypothetical protein